MNENQKKSLTQLSQELGVSKTALYRRVNSDPLASRLSPYMEKIKNTVYYSAEGVEIIVNSEEIAELKENSAQRWGSDSDHDPENESMVQLLQATMLSLQEQLAVKDKQIAEKDSQLAAKDNQIDTLTEALRESQGIQKETMLALQAAEALHNSTMQQLPEKKKKHWWSRKKKDDIIVDADIKED